MAPFLELNGVRVAESQVAGAILYVRTWKRYIIVEQGLTRLRSIEKLTTMNELSRDLGVSVTSLRRWIEIGLVPAPQFEGARAKLFTERQVCRIKKIIKERRMQRLKKRKEHGS